MIKFLINPKNLERAEVQIWESVKKNVKIIGFWHFLGHFT